MMSGVDEWGKDPAVRAMRKMFKSMEDSQGEFFSRLGINGYDPHIRFWREKALVLFEKTISRANRAGMSINEKTASDIYIHCLAHIMKAQGIVISETYLPEPIGIEGLLKESF